MASVIRGSDNFDSGANLARAWVNFAGTGTVAYRQALLDITTQTGFPNNVVWPTAPIV